MLSDEQQITTHNEDRNEETRKVGGGESPVDDEMNGLTSQDKKKPKTAISPTFRRKVQNKGIPPNTYKIQLVLRVSMDKCSIFLRERLRQGRFCGGWWKKRKEAARTVKKQLPITDRQTFLSSQYNLLATLFIKSNHKYCPGPDIEPV